MLAVVPARGRAGLLEELVPDEQRHAQRAAGVAGRGLDPDVLERRPRAGSGRCRRSSAPRRRPGRGSSFPVTRATWRAMRSMISSVTTWIDAARSISRCVDRRLAVARRAAEERVEPASVIVRPWQ